MKLLIAISSHGYGHLAQCRSLIWGLKQQGCDVEMTIQCTHPADFVKSRLGIQDIKVVNVITEPTIPMKDVLTVDVAKLLHLYHPDNAFSETVLNKNIELQAEYDAVISNVGFYPLLAAQKSGKKNAAFCCLNWADIVDYYAETPQKDSVTQMRNIYNRADFFALTEPYMQAPWLTNSSTILPIITPNQNGQLPETQPFDPHSIRTAFITTSDASMPLDLSELPIIDGITWHINAPHIPKRADIKKVRSIDFDSMLDTSDLCITKPGYGLFTECAYRQKPVISINRLDWPEQQDLLVWMRQYARIAEIPLTSFSTTSLIAAIEKIKSLEKPQSFKTGNHQLAKKVINWLSC